MIIGNGFIANNLRKIDSDDLLIFASGVSNSLIDNNDSGLQREISLIEEHKDTEKKIIYFGTLSIFDRSRRMSAYVKHKLYIEKLIKKLFKNYIIFRLPLVIGKSKNNNTLLNYMRLSILENFPMKIYENATRYLIDVEDVARVCSYISKSENKKIINVCFSEKCKVIDILNFLENALRKSAHFEVIKGGSSYTVNNGEFLEIYKEMKIDIYTKDYYKNLIFKYYNK